MYRWKATPLSYGDLMAQKRGTDRSPQRKSCALIPQAKEVRTDGADDRKSGASTNLHADDIKAQTQDLRVAADAVQIYEAFLRRPNLSNDDVEKATEDLKKWNKLASEHRVRWGRTWRTPDEVRGSISKEEQLLREAHRLIEVKNDELARTRFEQASKENPESIRADFYLGLLHVLVGRNPQDAERCFSRCITRLDAAGDLLSAAQAANLAALHNNRAICRVRLGRHSQALKDFVSSIEMRLAPRNSSRILAFMRIWQLSRIGAFRRHRLRQSLTNTQSFSVRNESAQFRDGVGWLFIPYVDSLVFPTFEPIEPGAPHLENVPGQLVDVAKATGAEDLRVVAWSTAFAVDREYLVTSSRLIRDAFGLWIMKAGQPRRDTPGKIVAISTNQELALLRFRGLGAQAIPLSPASVKLAADFRILTFPQR